MAGQVRRLFGVACVVAASAVIVASTALAAAPGKNGQIAFRRYFDANQTFGAVFTVNADGTNAKQVTRPPAGIVDDQPEWAPDGGLIAFTRCAPSALCHVFVVAPDGSGLTPVGPLCPTGANEQSCPDDEHASFSPDSKTLALVQATGTVKEDPSGETWIEHSGIALLNVDGSARHVIYQGAPFSGDLGYPVFSPDGKQLVFERTVSGFSKPAGEQAVFVMGADGSAPRRLTPWAEKDGDNPDWSPDGKWIIFHSHVDDPSRQSQIYLIHPDGSGRRQLTHFKDGTHVASSAFSPDGKWIAISKGPEGGNIDVYVVRLDGTHMRRVTHSKLWESAPDWGSG